MRRPAAAKVSIRALHDALAADVDPRAGGHLAVHGEARAFEPVELVPVRPVAHQVGVGDEDARRFGVRAEDADRLAGLDQQRFVVLEALEGADDGVEAVPVARGFAGAAVDDEVVGALGDFGIEVVHQHAQGGFLMPAFACAGSLPRGARMTSAVVSNIVPS